jgi:hypothetical protein
VSTAGAPKYEFRRVGDETLVYELGSHEVHLLNPEAAEEFARPGLDRRKFLQASSVAGTLLGAGILESAFAPAALAATSTYTPTTYDLYTTTTNFAASAAGQTNQTLPATGIPPYTFYRGQYNGLTSFSLTTLPYWLARTYVSPPSAPTGTSDNTGTDYVYTLTAVNARGETAQSPSVTIRVQPNIGTTGSNKKTASIGIPALPAGATSMNLYVGGKLLVTGVTPNSTYVDSVGTGTTAPQSTLVVRADGQIYLDSSSASAPTSNSHFLDNGFASPATMQFVDTAAGSTSVMGVRFAPQTTAQPSTLTMTTSGAPATTVIRFYNGGTTGTFSSAAAVGTPSIGASATNTFTAAAGNYTYALAYVPVGNFASTFSFSVSTTN